VPRDSGGEKKEVVAMKNIIARTKVLGGKVSLMLAPSLLVASTAFADSAGNTGSGGMSPLMLGFLIFFGVIIMLQLIPAVVIFGSLISAVFKRSKKATETGTVNEQA
jgi:hypothetical protein